MVIEIGKEEFKVLLNHNFGYEVEKEYADALWELCGDNHYRRNYDTFFGDLYTHTYWCQNLSCLFAETGRSYSDIVGMGEKKIEDFCTKILKSKDKTVIKHGDGYLIVMDRFYNEL